MGEPNMFNASTKRLIAFFSLALASAFLLTACGDSQTVFPDKKRGETSPVYGERKDTTVFGDGGLFGPKRKKEEEAGGGIGVNAYLWRASLDTLNFMPLASADPFGGVIITDWYSPPETPSERFKMNVYILDRALRADGIRVTAFRQTRDPSGNWVDMKVEAKTATDIENSILTRARQMRLANTEQKN
jgi:hypothetical protein